MKVTVLGKDRVNGVNKKTGEVMNKTVVHCSYKSRRTEGAAVQSVWVDASILPYEEIVVGKVYDLDRNERGFVDDFALSR